MSLLDQKYMETSSTLKTKQRGLYIFGWNEEKFEQEAEEG
jgi:hypothetical protein